MIIFTTFNKRKTSLVTLCNKRRFFPKRTMQRAVTKPKTASIFELTAITRHYATPTQISKTAFKTSTRLGVEMDVKKVSFITPKEKRKIQNPEIKKELDKLRSLEHLKDRERAFEKQKENLAFKKEFAEIEKKTGKKMSNKEKIAFKEKRKEERIANGEIIEKDKEHLNHFFIVDTKTGKIKTLTSSKGFGEDPNLFFEILAPGKILKGGKGAFFPQMLYPGILDETVPKRHFLYIEETNMIHVSHYRMASQMLRLRESARDFYDAHQDFFKEFLVKNQIENPKEKYDLLFYYIKETLKDAKRLGYL